MRCAVQAESSSQALRCKLLSRMTTAQKAELRAVLVEDCDNAQNCVKVCPKNIPLTESIAAVNGQVIWHAIKSWFVGH